MSLSNDYINTGRKKDPQPGRDHINIFIKNSNTRKR